MANQPPLRPWSRLAALRSALASQSHPPSALPTSKTESTASSHPSQSSEPTSGAAARASQYISQARNTSSPYKNANATKSLPTTPPPSKLNVNTLSEPKILVEEEPKTVLVNMTTERPNGNGSLHQGLNKKLSDFEDSSIRVITIAGENKGAYMEIIQSRKKPNHLLKMGNSKIYESEKSVSGEGYANKCKKVRTVTSPPMSGVYMNSNVQCVNSSLLLHTSCTHHDPGVHLTLSKYPFGEGSHPKDQRNLIWRWHFKLLISSVCFKLMPYGLVCTIFRENKGLVRVYKGHVVDSNPCAHPFCGVKFCDGALKE